MASPNQQSSSPIPSLGSSPLLSYSTANHLPPARGNHQQAFHGHPSRAEYNNAVYFQNTLPDSQDFSVADQVSNANTYQDFSTPAYFNNAQYQPYFLQDGQHRFAYGQGGYKNFVQDRASSSQNNYYPNDFQGVSSSFQENDQNAFQDVSSHPQVNNQNSSALPSFGSSSPNSFSAAFANFLAPTQFNNTILDTPHQPHAIYATYKAAHPGSAKAADGFKNIASNNGEHGYPLRPLKTSTLNRGFNKPLSRTNSKLLVANEQMIHCLIDPQLRDIPQARANVSRGVKRKATEPESTGDDMHSDRKVRTKAELKGKKKRKSAKAKC